ncbi:hypothetical protein PINS_up003037 [Pythium insidiosum]|nr:hypothetical protein PINS_up003037 [Pythium insidiosum]
MHPDMDNPVEHDYDAAYGQYASSNSSTASSVAPTPTSSTTTTATASKKTAAAGKENDRSLTISTNAPMNDKANKAAADKASPTDKDAAAKDASQRPDHLKPRLCTVPGCKKRVRSKGLCKAHGGGRRCMVEGCERSSQGQGLCIRHGGGKRCTQPGCTKASQSNGLCKAHGGGLRCQAPNCTKSSQGGGFCRAHGGGQRCEKEGCNKGAQRGGFCAGHGGSRFCQHPDCTKNDRGGGFCAEHGGGKRCDEQGCNKPARKKGKCSYHANANKQKVAKDAVPAVPSQMMDMRQITVPAAAYGSMAGMPKDMVGARDPMDQHPSMRPYYSRMDMDQRYAKGYDQPLPLPTNSASSQYLPMHADQRGYDMGMSQAAPRHYMSGMDNTSLPSVSSGYSASQHKHQQMMDRSSSPYNPARGGHANPYSHWSKESVAPTAMPERNLDYFDMKDQTAPHHQAYGGASAQYHHHLSAADSAAAAAAYGAPRDSYYHHPSSNDATNLYGSYGYPPHQMHGMNLL